MKKVIALLVAMSTTAVFAGVDYASKYIYRGETLNTSAAIQPSMDTNVLGLDVGAWASYDTGNDEFQEVDFSVGYDVTEVAGVGVSVGLTEYIYTAEASTAEADTEASLFLDYAVAGIDLSAALNKTIDGATGDYTILGASYGFDISAELAGSVSYEVGTLDDGTTDDEAYSAITVAADLGTFAGLDVGVAYTTINDGDLAGYVTEDDVLVVSINGDLF